jgi:hypothetical protein
MANTPRVCRDFTASGLDGTMTLAGTSIGLTVSGSLSWPATNFTRTYTGTTTFNATTTGKTVTTNGVAFGSTVTFDGVGGGWTLGSALNLPGSTLGVSNGTFDTSTSNYAISAGNIQSNNSNVRTINLNASTVTLNGTSVIAFTTATNLTFNAGTSQINCSIASPVFAGGGKTFYNVSFTSTAGFTPSITGANTFNNLSVTGRTSVGICTITISAGQTINGTFTVSAGSASAYRIMFASDVLGTTRTLTCAAVSLTDVDFRDITIAGAASPATGTRLGDCKGNSGITFPSAKTVYYAQTGSSNWGSTTSWSATSGGSSDATMFPLAQDTAVFPAATYPASGSTTTINANYNIGTIDMSLRTSNTMTLATGTTTPFIYGNWTNGTGITFSGTGALTFAGRGVTQQITNAAFRNFVQPIVINSITGTFQLQDNFFASTGTGSVTLTSGTLDLQSYQLKTLFFSSNNSNTRTIAFGTGKIVCESSGIVWNTSTVTGLTTTGTQVVDVTSVGSTAITVNSGALSEANSISFNFTGGTYTLTFLSTSGHTARSVDYTGFSGLLGATSTATIYGDYKLSAAMTILGTSSTLTFGATSGIQKITSNGNGFNSPITINGVGGTRQLQDNFLTGTTRTTTLTNGALDLQSYTLSTGLFSSSNSNTRTIAFGTGQINCTGTGTVWTTATATNLTTTGTQVVNVTSAGPTAITVNSGALSEANSISYNFTGGTYALTFLSNTDETARNVNFTGYAGTLQALGTTVTVYGNITFSAGMTLTSAARTMIFGSTSGTKTITSNGKTLDFSVTFNGVGGTWQLQDAMTVGATRTTTLTNGTLNFQSFTLSTGLFSSNNSNVRTIAFGTGQMSVTGVDTVWETSTVTNLSVGGSKTVNVTSSGSTAITVRTGLFSEADALDFNFTGGTYSLNLPPSGTTSSVRNLNFTGYSGQWSGSLNDCYIYGNCVLSSSMTFSFVVMRFASTSGTKTITSNGATLTTFSSLVFNGVGGTWQLQDNFTTTYTVVFSNGTLDLNGKILSTDTASTAAGTKNITFNGGTLALNGASLTAWYNLNPTGLTTTAGTGTGKISMTAAGAKQFFGSGSTYNCTLEQAGVGTLTISGSNTFLDITNTVQPTTIIFDSATTQTFINGFSLSGTAGNLVTLDVVTSGTRANLSKSSGTVSVSYCSIKDSNATGGATWEALTSNGNVNGGNNNGWIFGSAGGTGNMFLMF